MAIVVETGAGLVNSNSYVEVSDLEAYAAERGETLPDPSELEPLLHNAMDYLEAIPNYKGLRKTATQALAWPRIGVVIDGFQWDSAQIPPQLKRAQLQLAIEAIEFDLMPSSDGFAVAKEKVDVLEVEYATGGRLSGETLPTQPIFPRVDALLAPIIEKVGMRLRSKRI